MDLDKFREIFLKRKEELERSINNDLNLDLDGDGDEVDEIQARSIGRIAAHLTDKKRKQLKDINIALKKIEDGTFGICEECGEEIGEKRLLAKPEAVNCITCAEKSEMLKKQFS